MLIVKPSSLGDVVHTLPAVHALKKARPDWRLSWMVNTEWAPLLEGNPDLEEVIPFPRNQFRGLGGMRRLALWLKGLDLAPLDLALDFQGLARSALLARWSRAQRVHCLGNAELLPRWLADRVVPVLPHEHAVQRYLRMVADLGVPISHPPFILPAGAMPGARLPERFLLLHPFSRGAGKSLEPETVQEICAGLPEHRIVIVGKSELSLKAPSNCTDLLNRTSLTELIWLIRRASFTVSVDSGPMHIAAAITPRLLSIHTWSDPRKVGPFQPEAWIWKNACFQQVKNMQPSGESTPFRIGHVPGLTDFLRQQLKTGN